jgi:serine protease Do
VKWRVSILAGLLVLAPWARAEAQTMRELFQRVSPSVVVIRPLDPSLGPSGLVGPASGFGSGVVISNDGKVMTSAHLVQTADRVGVQFHDGSTIPARVVASAPRADVALLQLEGQPTDVASARLADSDLIAVGDEVFVIGAPYGLHHSFSAGHLSGRQAPHGAVGGVTVEYLQTDAAINAGNSGGPIFNMKGEVVGIVSHILSRSGGFEGLGFAVPSNVAARLLLSPHSWFWSGVDFVPLSGEVARILNVPQPAGLLIQRVAAGSPGAMLGLQAGTLPMRIGSEEMVVGGDIVLEVAGRAITPQDAFIDELEAYLAGLPPGTEVSVKVLRAGQVIEFKGVVP